MSTVPNQLNLIHKLASFFKDIDYTFKDPKKALELLATSPVNPFVIAQVLDEQKQYKMGTTKLERLIQACDCGLDIEKKPEVIHSYNLDQVCMGYVQGIGDILIQNFEINKLDNTLCEIRKALLLGAKVEDLKKGFGTKQLKIINKCIKANMDISVLSSEMTVKEMEVYLETGELKKMSKIKAIDVNRQKAYDRIEKLWSPAFGKFDSNILENLSNHQLKRVIRMLKYSYMAGKMTKEVAFKSNMTYDEIMNRFEASYQK